MADRNANIILSLRNQASPEIRRIASDYRQFIGELQQGGASIDVAERKMLSLAQAKARALTASGQAARGEQELTAALGLVTQRSSTAYNAQTQLANIQTKLAGGSKSAAQGTDRFASSLKGVNTGLAALGVSVGIATVAAFAKDAIAAANSLDKTEATVRALSGSQTRYVQVLQLARAGQQTYGGSLEENLRGLGSLVNLSNRAGVELGKLDNISRRLAIIDPVQGIEGANIALKEFLAGNGAEAAVSLARRFELPKKALADLAREGTTAQQRLAGLDALLNQQGISSDVLAGQARTLAATYDQLGAAGDNAKVAVGQLLAVLLRFPAQVTTKILIAVENGLGTLANSDQALQDFATKAFTGAKSFDDYGQRVAFANAQLAQFGVHIASLSPTTFAYAQALVQTGVAADVAFQRAQNYGTIVDRVTAAQSAAGTSGGDWSNQLGSLGQRAAESAAKSDYNRQAIESLTTAYEAGGLTAPEFAKAIDALNARFQQSQVDAANSAKGIIDWANAAQGALASLPKTLKDTSGQGFTPTPFQTLGRGAGDRAKPFFQGVKDANDQAQRLAQLQLQGRLINAKTSAERIAILQQELKGTTDVLERQRIQNEIDQERNSAAKGHTSELNKQLNLEERIYDSKNKQLKATLDASAAIIRDRQAKRDEEQQLRTADRVLAALGGRTDARAEDFRGRAQDRRDLILIEQQQRQLDIQEKLATSNGQIINGKLYQSRPGGGTASVPTPGQAVAVGVPAIPTPGGAGGGGQAIVLQLVDGAGRVLAQTVEPFIMDELMQGVRAVKITKGA